jgi:hypothetical protein
LNPTATTKTAQPTSTSKPNQEESDTDDAESSNNAHQKDPTNKSLAEKFMSDIEKALDSKSERPPESLQFNFSGYTSMNDRD